jgi:hypothetical protein
VAFILLPLCAPLLAQKTGKSEIENEAVAAPQTVRVDIDQVLVEAHRLAEEANGLEFKDDEIGYLIAMADSVWEHDQPFARRLLTRSLDLAVDLFRTQSAIKSPAKRKDPRLLFRQVALIAGKHDAKFEKQLTESWEASLSSESDKPKGMPPGSPELSYLLLQASADVVGKDEQRGRILFRQSAANRVLADHCHFLMKRRESSGELADRMFSDALGALAERPLYDANEILTLSSYLFSPSESISYLLVSGFNAANVSGNASAQPKNALIAKQYLALLLSKLTPGDTIPTAVAYMGLKNLLPQYQVFAPELLDEVYAALGRFGPNVPSDDTNRLDWVNKDRAASQLNSSWEDRLKTADKVEDAGLRDLAYITLIRAQLLPGRLFRKALEVAGRISDRQLSEQMIDLVSLTDLQTSASADHELEALADADCERIKNPVARVIAFATLVQSRVDHKIKNDVLHLLERAETETKSIRDDQDRAQAQLMVAQLYAGAESPDAFDNARSAVKEINKFPDFNMRRSTFSLKFSVKGLSNELFLKSPPSSLISTVNALSRLDFVQAIAVSRLLEDRKTRLWAGFEGVKIGLTEPNKKTATKEGGPQ